MRVITADTVKDVDYAPFRDKVATWNALQSASAKGLPSVITFLQQPDDLADYRIASSVRGLEPLSITYDQVGATLEALYGGTMTGQSLDMLYNDWFRKSAYQECRACMDARQPIYVRRTIAAMIKKLGYYKLHLPFGDSTTTDIVTYIVPMDPNMRTRADWEKYIKLTPWL